MSYGHRFADTTEKAAGPSPLVRFVQAFLVWFAVYLLVQGQDGFFAITADRIDSMWVKFIFLNIPLQLVLTLATVGCVYSGNATLHRAGWVFALLNSTLILVHVGLSIATAS